MKTHIIVHLIAEHDTVREGEQLTSSLAVTLAQMFEAANEQAAEEDNNVRIHVVRVDGTTIKPGEETLHGHERN